MTATIGRGLQGLILLEKDINNDIISWQYPSIDKSLLSIVKGRSGLSDMDIEYGFRFSKFGSQWQYYLTMPLPTAPDNFSQKVTAVSIIILASSYNPQKFQAFLTILIQLFINQPTLPLSPVPLLTAYLSFFTTGKYTTRIQNPATKAEQILSFDEGSFDDRKALLAPIKTVLSTFSTEAILLWTAMLMKKRIIVINSSSSENNKSSDNPLVEATVGGGVGGKVSELINFVRTLPIIGAWHRQDFSLLRPYVRLENAAEIEDLSKTGIYVAGFTDSSVSARKDLWDALVDLSAKNIIINDNAKNDFIMTKYHKATIELFLKSAETENEQSIIKTIAVRTKELLEQIASLKIPDTNDPSKSYISAEHLSTQKLPPNMDKFIYSVALAEGMTKK